MKEDLASTGLGVDVVTTVRKKKDKIIKKINECINLTEQSGKPDRFDYIVGKDRQGRERKGMLHTFSDSRGNWVWMVTEEDKKPIEVQNPKLVPRREMPFADILDMLKKKSMNQWRRVGKKIF